MKDIRKYTILEKEYKATNWMGIILLVFFILAKWIFKIDLNLYSNPIQFFGLASLQMIIYITAWIIIINSMVRSYKIAKELRRNSLIWVISALIATPITLIVIANIGEKYDDEELRKIVKECRDDFNTDLGKLINNHSIDKEEEKEQAKELIKKHDSELHRKLISKNAEALLEHINVLIDQEIISSNIDLDEQRKIIENDIKNNLFENDIETQLCSACSAKISEKSIICPECELTLNNAT